jgi:hypothetical protein
MCPMVEARSWCVRVMDSSLETCASAWQQFERSALYVYISSGDIASSEEEYASRSSRRRVVGAKLLARAET